MKIITVNLPVSYLKCIDGLIGDTGLYPSRSELVRVAIREFLIKELETAQSFNDLLTKEKPQPTSQIDESLFVRVPVCHAPNAEDTEYKTFRIIKK